MFYLSYDRKDLALRVTVSNTGGDDAYEAKLLANFSSVLSYSGFRSPTLVRETDDALVRTSQTLAHGPDLAHGVIIFSLRDHHSSLVELAHCCYTAHVPP